MLNEKVLAAAGRLRQRFQTAKPFKHLMIDDFFTPEAAEALLADFPPFDPRYALAESGKVGGKAVVTDIAAISDFYRRVHAYITSRGFLDAMSAITGIPDLEADPSLFGAGTHDNRHGQDLLPHVDFNYDRSRTLHRRLNLLLYLNKDWDEAWGGAIQIHSDPRKPDRNAIKTINVLFNRAVMFETNEHSWHGFRVIDLPEDKRHLSRKALAIYFYTKDRPAAEIAPLHGTFYWHWPLDARYRAGYVLTETDETELKQAVAMRDAFIGFYQNKELELSGQIRDQGAYIASILGGLRAPVMGYAVQQGESQGLMPDGWTGGRATFTLVPERPVYGLEVRGWLPDHLRELPTVTLRIDGREMAVQPAANGPWSLGVRFAAPLSEAIAVELDCDRTFSGKRQGVNEDTRELGFNLMAVRLSHRDDGAG